MRKSSMHFALVSVVAVILIAGCAPQVSRDDAERAARGFLEDRVKFFQKEGGTNQTLEASLEFSPDSYEEKDRFVFILKAKARALSKNGTVQKDLVVEVDKRSGRVVKFQGVRITG